MFVLTVDQRHSRRDIDRVDALLDGMSAAPLLRAFERTAGDEVQAVADSAVLTARLAVALAADGHWTVGVGVGAVIEPLPMSTRAGRGPAFENARTAVEGAKGQRIPIAVHGGAPRWSQHAQTAARLLTDVIAARSDQGIEAVELVRDGLTQADAAQRLGISAQAMSQRLRSARWDIEDDARRLVADLLQIADTASDDSIDNLAADRSESAR